MQEMLKVAPILKADEIKTGDIVYVSFCIMDRFYETKKSKPGYGIVLDKNPNISEYLIETLYKVLLYGEVFWCTQNEVYKIYFGRTCKN